jgi:hypothetical protein
MPLNGTTAATATVTVTTTSQTVSAQAMRLPPGGDLRPGLKPKAELWVLLLAILAFLATSTASYRGAHGVTMMRLRARVKFVVLVMMVFLLAAEMACNQYYYSPITTATLPGTPTGNYTIAITGTLGNNNAVARTTTVNLTVGSG